MKRSFASCFMLVLAFVICLPALSFGSEVKLVPPVDVSLTTAEAPMAGNPNDLQFGEMIVVRDQYEFTPISCKFQDTLDYYDYYGNEFTYKSGKEADFVYLRFDVLNTSPKGVDVKNITSVKVIFDNGKAEYQGWSAQYNYEKSEIRSQDHEASFEIGPYYVGHFGAGCTLPNAVVSSEKPLKMVISIGDQDLIYYIRN